MPSDPANPFRASITMNLRLPILSLVFAGLCVPGHSVQAVAPVLPEKPALFPPKPAADSPAVSRRDLGFIKDVLEINQNERVIAQLVAERAITREVSALARQLVSDLDAAAQELRALAEKKHIPLPELRSEAGDLKTWNEKDPKTLDADYLDRVKDVLDDLADLYENAAKKSTDPEFAAFAKKLLPAVREQRQRAEKTTPTPAPPPPDAK